MFVTVDDRERREEQLARSGAPDAAGRGPPEGFRVIAAHDGWRALGPPVAERRFLRLGGPGPAPNAGEASAA